MRPLPRCERTRERWERGEDEAPPPRPVHPPIDRPPRPPFPPAPPPPSPSQYAGGEPCSICGHTLALSAPPRAATRPGEATPRVLFGSYDNAAMCDLLKSLGVTHVLNVSERKGGGGGRMKRDI